MASALTSSAAQTRSIIFRRDAFYEVQALWQRPDGEASLDTWCDRSDALATAHGGAPLMELEPVKALYGEYTPTRVRLITWPDVDAFDAARADPGVAPEMAELDALLDRAVSEATVTLTRLHPEIHAHPEIFDVELDDRLCYEICTFWDDPEAPRAAWDAFIAAATPSIESHGGHPLLVFAPLRCQRGEFFPSRLCIAAWDSVEHFESFVTAPEQPEISRLRSLAVAHMDATATLLRRG